MKLKILFITPYPVEGPSSRYRVWQYLPYFEKADFFCKVRSFLDSNGYNIFYKKGHLLNKIFILIKGFFKRLFLLPIVPTYDIVFIQKEAFPFGPPFFETALKWLNNNIIYDFDDAIYLPQTSEGNRIFQFLKSSTKTRKVIRISKEIFAGNKTLADYAKQYNSNVKIIPTTIDTSFYRAQGIPKTTEAIVIGWMGSRTSAPYLLEVEEALTNIKIRFGDRVKIVIIGGDNFRFKDFEAEYKPWNMAEELTELHNFDIGMMPLPDNEWTQGKCGFKALLYMSVGIPAVCAAVGVNREIITHEQNAFLIETKNDWEPVFTRLIQDADLRKKIGTAARQKIIDQYSLDQWAAQLVDLLNNLK